MEDVVLVGYDGSPASSRALDWAIDEARLRGWPLRLVTAFSPAQNIADPMVEGKYVELETRRGESMLQEALERAKNHGVTVESRVVAGNPGGVLVDLSKSAALAVVGKRGRGGFAGRLMGSVSAGLAAHSKCPTVVIPEVTAPGRNAGGTEAGRSEVPARRTETAPVPWLVSAPDGMSAEGVHPDDESQSWSYAGQIVMAMDALGSKNPALWAAAEAAQFHAKALTLVSTRAPYYRDSVWLDHAEGASRFRQEVAHDLDTVLADVRSRYPEVKASWQFYIAKPAEILVQATQTADLLVLGTRGHGGFPGLLLGSVSQAVLQHGASPMMVVPRSRQQAEQH
jgi:nucleotide-binding universal stress UspA family protein